MKRSRRLMVKTFAQDAGELALMLVE